MRITLASALASILATSAIAGGYADPPPAATVMPAPAPSVDWSGGYVGLQFGALNGDLDLAGENLNNNNTTSASIGVSGHEVGIFAGYNWAGANNLVYGIEGEYNVSNVDGTHPGVPGPSFGFIRNGIDADIDRTAALRGRLGYAMDQGLLYATAGIAWARVSLDGTPGGGGAGGGAGGGPFNPTETLTGWTIGAGYEHAINANWTLRVDYRYSDLDGSFDFLSGGGGGGPDPHRFDLDLQSHQVRIGAAYRF
jgi:outer membrane immunogenic protein